jgi:hypothetical protein
MVKCLIWAAETQNIQLLDSTKEFGTWNPLVFNFLKITTVGRARWIFQQCWWIDDVDDQRSTIPASSIAGSVVDAGNVDVGDPIYVHVTDLSICICHMSYVYVHVDDLITDLSICICHMSYVYDLNFSIAYLT